MNYVRRTALFVLRDKIGRLLLQHRDKDVSRRPDHWAFFGGEIEEGETPEEAVRREAKQELDIELRNLELFKRYEFEQEDGLYDKFVFAASLDIPIEELKKQQKEGQDLGLFYFEELDGLKVSDYDRTILKDLFNKHS